MKIKMVALALLLAMFSAACGVSDDGRGSEVVDCGNEGTNIVANYDDPVGHENPAFLVEHNIAIGDPDDVEARKSGFFTKDDEANEIGEVACINEDGETVLTGCLLYTSPSPRDRG